MAFNQYSGEILTEDEAELLTIIDGLESQASKLDQKRERARTYAEGA